MNPPSTSRACAARLVLSAAAALGPFSGACSPAAAPAVVPASSSAAPAASSAPGAAAAPAWSTEPEALYKPPADTHVEDSTLPAGSVAVELRDADGNPRSHESVFLAQISETPAPDVMGTTDEGGRLTLSAPAWIGTSARVVTRSGAGGIFFTSAFPIHAGGGVRATLHTYPSARNIDDARIVFIVSVLLDLDGADLHVTEAFSAYALSRVAWLPAVELPLPDGFTRFESSVFTETSLDLALQGQRAVLSGTIPPGQNDFEMSWRLPLRDGAATLRVPLPPHVAKARVLTPAGPATHLEAEGFPPSRVQQTPSSGPILVVERTMTPKERPLREVVVELRAPVTRPGT